MKAGKFAELVISMCGANDQDFSVGVQEVLGATEVAIASILASYVRNVQPIPDGFFVPYIVKVEYSSARQRRFCAPAEPAFVNLAGNSGIKSVGPSQDEYTSYINLKSGMLSTIKGLEVDALGGKTGYFVEGGKIWFENIDEALPDVLVRMIPRASEIDEEEDIFFSDEIEQVVLQMVVKEYMPKAQQFKEDKTNDGNKD